MALIFIPNCKNYHKPSSPINPNLKFKPFNFSLQSNRQHYSLYSSTINNTWKQPLNLQVVYGLEKDSEQSNSQDDEVDNVGVKAALAMLRFYKREISPLLPKSCRFVPTCSEYSMIAYKKYGVVKGTALTAWRLCRCNPLGGSGFDPPRWFDETTPNELDE